MSGRIPLGLEYASSPGALDPGRHQSARGLAHSRRCRVGDDVAYVFEWRLMSAVTRSNVLIF